MITVPLDFTPRYAPSTALVRASTGWMQLPVTGYRAYPPNKHPADCPLTPDCTALELRTAHGSRWYGVSSARINSELRMVITGIDPRDEIRMRWEVCTEV